MRETELTILGHNIQLNGVLVRLKHIKGYAIKNYWNF